MKILAIETASDVCGIAYIKNGKCEELIEKSIPRKHAEQLPLFYQKLIKKTGLKLSELDGIAISIGPGSFTGLRIGLSYGKGLAYSHGLSLIPVPTLKSLVYSYGQFEGTIRVLLHSHREIFFQQDFVWENNGLEILTKKQVTDLLQIKNNLEEIDSIFYYGGDSFLAKLDMSKIVKIQPSSELIGKLAEQNFANWNMENPFELIPDYTAPFIPH
jgi:tRNA threonylcarbamoyl adenosine modification protein YeaZ